LQIGIRRVDLLVEDRIAAALKAVPEPDKAHIAQALNYLELTI
jgi:hypothetical protein